MARIEFKNVEQKVSDLTGYWKGGFNDSANPYRADRLHDDDFNFVSGMNYVLSYMTDGFLANQVDFPTDDEDEDSLIFKIKKEIATKTIEDFAQWCYCGVGEYITSALESEEYNEDWEKWEQEEDN